MLTDYPEPKGLEAGREEGSTTLKQCGWCEYASGTHHYNYCVEGSCSLQKSYSKAVHWDDVCVFLDASKADIEAIIRNHRYTIESAERTIKSQKRYIRMLRKLVTKVPDRPSLPKDRNHDHFNINDPVAVWHSDDNWHFGEVRQGYRHHDGCVSYWLEDIGPQSSTEGFWGMGYAVPTVLLKSEWEFFQQNPEEYEKWCKRAYKEDFNGAILGPAPINGRD